MNKNLKNEPNVTRSGNKNSSPSKSQKTSPSFSWSNIVDQINIHHTLFQTENFKEKFTLLYLYLGSALSILIFSTYFLIGNKSLPFVFALLAYPLVTYTLRRKTESETSSNKALFIAHLALNISVFIGVCFSPSFIFLNTLTFFFLSHFALKPKSLGFHLLFNSCYFAAMSIAGLYQMGPEFIPILISSLISYIVISTFFWIKLQKVSRQIRQAPSLEKTKSEDVKNNELEQSISLVSHLNESLSKMRIHFKHKKNGQILFTSGQKHTSLKINCSPMSFQKIVECIVTNSMESQNKSDILVEIQLEELEKQVVLTIKDNGAGIPPLVKEKVFNKGYSFNKESKAGMGLYTVKSELNKWNGQILIASIPAKGTTIKLKFNKEHQGQSVKKVS